MAQGREVREMRDADTILAIIRERGGRGLPLEDVYRQLYNPALYLRAYGRIYRNDGAMTHGVTAETVDGMSLEKIQAIIESLKAERYPVLSRKRVGAILNFPPVGCRARERGQGTTALVPAIAVQG
jgi:hypothetical protein